MKPGALLVLFLAGILWAPLPALAAAPENASAAVAQAIRHGATLFASDHFGSTLRAPLSASAAFNGFGDGATQGPLMSCESCHSNGGRTRGRVPEGPTIASLVNASAIFPRYRKHHGVVTMGMQIRHCVRAGIHGRAPAYNSPELVDLEAYLGSLAQGQRIHVGGKPQ